MSSFVNFRTHTEYSVRDSTLRISDLISHAVKDGQPAVVMTDRDGMFGAIRFYNQAKEAGLQPIVGVDINLEFPPVNDVKMPSKRVVLIAENYEGYRKLMRLISKAYLHNLASGDVPVLRSEWIEQEQSTHLYCLSGDEHGFIGDPLILSATADADSPEKDQYYQQAKQNAQKLSELFPQRFFLEIQRRGSVHENSFVQGVSQISDELQIPLIATHPQQFASQSDYLGHEIKVCNQESTRFYDRKRQRNYTPYQHLIKQEDFKAVFSDFPDAIANAQALAQKCTLDIPLNKPVLPDFVPPNGQSLHDYFISLSQKGLEERLAFLFPNPEERASRKSEYETRLQYELGVIEQMGFEGYFMIVSDFIGWAKKHDIPVGPGRGSGAGSLVAYALKITDIDPLKYNLLFERFLNPERVSMPDFDIDFCQEKRELVIQYVTDRYGQEAVAGIATSTSLGAKAAIRAAGRVLDMPLPVSDRIAKLIPATPGKEVTISGSIEEDPSLKALYENDPEVAKILDYARSLEGLPNAIGKHAAGVVIAPTKIADYSPLYITQGNLQAVTQYDKDDVEKAGLVKFDFLGLKTLTEIDYAIRMIREELDQPEFDINRISLHDEETFKVFQRGGTKAVFQFESEGMQTLLRDARPDVFEDLIALVSLYRPGPMDLIPSFISRKHGTESVEYLDPRLEPILKETHGIMVYQEQVMQIAQVIGGYTLGGADLLRRAMGKKKVEEMALHRSIFVEGASKLGVSEAKATELFNTMEKFAGYGFNKSHAAAYAWVSYQTAYLKAHYPSAFYASWLTIEGSEDTANIPALLEDSRHYGLTVLPVDINESDSIFRMKKGQTHQLMYGMMGLKGIGRDIADEIVQARKLKGNFTSLYDFCSKVERASNKKTLEALVKAGAFDSLHPNREETLQYIPLLTKHFAEVKKIKAANKELSPIDAIVVASPVAEASTDSSSNISLVDETDPSSSPTEKKKKPKVIRSIKKKEPKPIPNPPDWPSLDPQDPLKKIQDEFDAYGFYFSDHPFRFFAKQLGGLPFAQSIAQLKQVEPSRQSHVFAGIVSEVSVKKTKNGKMIIAQISDGTSSIEVKGFSDLYNSVNSWFKKNTFVLMSGQVKVDNFSGGKAVTIYDAKNFNECQMLLSDAVQISIPPERYEELKNTIHEHCQCQGNIPVIVWHPAKTPDGKDTYVKSKEPLFYTEMDHSFLKTLEDQFESRFVKLRFKKEFSFPRPQGKNKPRN